jgi:hypothetical protein
VSWQRRHLRASPAPTPAGTAVLAQPHERLPYLSQATVRWLALSWATAIVFAHVLYLSLEHSVEFDDAWKRVGPAVTIAALANSIFLANWRPPPDQ